MASSPYFKSLIWLVTLGGIGYVLLQVTEPSAEKINKIKAISSSSYLSDDEKRNILFMQKLKQASQETPIYLQKKEK